MLVPRVDSVRGQFRKRNPLHGVEGDFSTFLLYSNRDAADQLPRDDGALSWLKGLTIKACVSEDFTSPLHTSLINVFLKQPCFHSTQQQAGN